MFTIRCLIFIQISVVAVSKGFDQSINAMKSCFERYMEQRLVEVRPYHSEWRMKNPEDCLLFCVDSSSRCRAIVYDAFQHICHYFMDDGTEHAVLSHGTIYFRVTSKECLDNFVRSSNVVRSRYDNPPTEVTSETNLSITTTMSTTFLTVEQHFSTPLEPSRTITTNLDNNEVHDTNDFADFSDTSQMSSSSKPQVEKMPTVETFDDENQYFTDLPTRLPDQISTYSKETTAPTLVEERKLDVTSPAHIIHEVRIPDSGHIHRASFTQQHINPVGVKFDSHSERAIRVNPKTPEARIIHESDSNLEAVLGAAMLPPMEMHKPIKIQPSGRKSKAIKNKPEFSDGIRRSPIRHHHILMESHNEQDQPIMASGKWESNEQDDIRISHHHILPVKNELNSHISEERNGDDDIAITDKFDKRVAPYASKAEKIDESIRMKSNQQTMEENLELAMSEASEVNVESSIDDASLAVPTMKVISMKMTRQQANNEHILSPACPNSENDVWLSIENAVLDMRTPQKSSVADSAHSCKIKCNSITNAGRDCPAITYRETERECISYTNNVDAIEALRLKASPINDFSTRTLVKFCYPGSLKAFNGCAEFTSFHDYTLELSPREQFDGMPNGYAGLQACLELCVLSPNFYCKSASFFIDEGRCVLRDENSLSKSDLFREHLHKNEIYFENGCDKFYPLPEQVPSEAQMIRVPLKSVLRSIRIQPQRSNRFPHDDSP